MSRGACLWYTPAHACGIRLRMSVAYGHLRDTLRQITPSPVFLSVAALPSADTLRPATVDMHRRDRPHSPLVRDTPLFNRDNRTDKSREHKGRVAILKEHLDHLVKARDRDDVVYWYLIQYPLHRSAYASLGRVCTLRKVPTIRGCLGGLALMA